MFTSTTRTLNSNDPNADNYAILEQLESFRSSDGKFYFKLEWPGDDTIFEWSQSSNPLTENVAGYSAITVPYTGKYWGGLEPSGDALMDGSVNQSGQWWYAVGAYSIWQGGYPSYAKSDTDNVYPKQIVEFYVEKKSSNFLHSFVPQNVK